MGTILNCKNAVDNTKFMALSSLTTEQAKPMAKTIAKIMQLLDYLATQDDAIMTYNASNNMCWKSFQSQEGQYQQFGC
jgi:hypothetical protein